MLEGDDDHARRAGRVPIWCRADPWCAERKMPFVVDDRVSRVGMLVVILREENGSPEVYGMTPPFGEDAALDLDAADVAAVGGDDDGWDDPVSLESYRFGIARIEGDADRIAVAVAGERFQFWPSHWSMCSHTVWPSARANLV